MQIAQGNTGWCFSQKHSRESSSQLLALQPGSQLTELSARIDTSVLAKSAFKVFSKGAPVLGPIIVTGCCQATIQIFVKFNVIDR